MLGVVRGEDCTQQLRHVANRRRGGDQGDRGYDVDYVTVVRSFFFHAERSILYAARDVFYMRRKALWRCSETRVLNAAIPIFFMRLEAFFRCDERDS